MYHLRIYYNQAILIEFPYDTDQELTAACKQFKLNFVVTHLYATRSATGFSLS